MSQTKSSSIPLFAAPSTETESKKKAVPLALVGAHSTQAHLPSGLDRKRPRAAGSEPLKIAIVGSGGAAFARR